MRYELLVYSYSRIRGDAHIQTNLHTHTREKILTHKRVAQALDITERGRENLVVHDAGAIEWKWRIV